MRNLRLSLCAVALLVLTPSFATAAQRVPRGAYVRKPVTSVDGLAAQIAKDPVVRNRFARHFGVPTEQLEQYIRDNVVITKVTASTPRNVYICTRSGRLVAEHKILRRGTAIFALKDTGEPLLVQSCGNPVVKKLPPRVKVKAEAPAVYQVMRPNEIPLPPPVAVLPPVSASPAPAPVVAPSIPPAVAPPPAAVPPVVAAARHPSLLPLLPLVGLFGDHGHHKSTPPPAPPPPIPEPGGVAAVVAAALLPAVGWSFRRIINRRSSARSV